MPQLPIIYPMYPSNIPPLPIMNPMEYVPCNITNEKPITMYLNQLPPNLNNNSNEYEMQQPT